MGGRASYIYTWRGDYTHASAPLGATPRETWSATLPERDRAWRKLQTDPGDGKTPLTPADVLPRYRDLLAHCKVALTDFEQAQLAAALRPYLEGKA